MTLYSGLSLDEERAAKSIMVNFEEEFAEILNYRNRIAETSKYLVATYPISTPETNNNFFNRCKKDVKDFRDISELAVVMVIQQRDDFQNYLFAIEKLSYSYLDNPQFFTTVKAFNYREPVEHPEWERIEEGYAAIRYKIHFISVNIVLANTPVPS